MVRRDAVLALLVLLAAAAGVGAPPRRIVDPDPSKPAPILTRQQVWEEFRKLSAAERLHRVRKVAKDRQAFIPVTRGDLAVSVTERGTLEAVDAFDVICQVKARSQVSSVATTVRSVIDDGTLVKKGDTLVTLDDSALKEQLRAQTTLVKHATATKIATEVYFAFVRTEATAVLVAATVALAAREEERRRDLLAQLRACVIKAPRAGRVAYYIPRQPRWGVSRQSIVACGEPVSEGQKLLQVYGPQRFRFTTRIHENLIARVRVGQAAVVRADPFPDRVLCGRVKWVSSIACSESFLSSDVRVYTVKVDLDPRLPGLKPDLTGTVRIAGGKRQKVLRLPLESVLRKGRKTFCFVKSGKGVEKRAVKAGLDNDIQVEIKKGLKEEELVLRDPRWLASLLAPWPGPTQVVVRGLRPDPSGRPCIEYGLTHEDLKRMGTLRNVAEVVPVRRFPLGASCRKHFHAGQVIGTVPAFREFADLRLAAGRFLLDEDNSRKKSVVVLGAEAARRLSPGENAVGKGVYLRSHYYLVVGVLRRQDRLAGPLTANLVNRGVFLPLRTCEDRFFSHWIQTRQNGLETTEIVWFREILVTARTPEQVPRLVADIAALLQKSHPRKDWDIRSASPQREQGPASQENASSERR